MQELECKINRMTAFQQIEDLEEVVSYEIDEIDYQQFLNQNQQQDQPYEIPYILSQSTDVKKKKKGKKEKLIIRQKKQFKHKKESPVCLKGISVSQSLKQSFNILQYVNCVFNLEKDNNQESEDFDQRMERELEYQQKKLSMLSLGSKKIHKMTKSCNSDNNNKSSIGQIQNKENLNIYNIQNEQQLKFNNNSLSN